LVASTVNDSALVAGVRAAEPYAVSALYDAYADQLFAYCVSSLRHHDDAADATQDTFVKAIEHIDQLRDPAKLRPWLFTIARHEVANQGRRRARLRLVDDEPDSPAEVPEPTKELSQEELSDLLWSAASGLQSRDREVMALHLRSGMDAPEIAAVLGISVEHARVLMARMRDRLERSIGCLLLARHGGDDCDGLARTLRGWDGQFSVRVRDRVNRHASAWRPRR